jgi:DNA-binding response OmpR family regulator
MSLGAGRTILFVNDHPGERESIRRVLTGERFIVEHASDYHSAVKFLEGKVPRLVCLDLRLPRESGYELCEHIRSQRKFDWVPILVMSERGSPEEMAHAEQLGANAYLKKPFSNERLLKYLGALLDGPMASRPSIRRLARSEPPPG